MSTLPPPIFHVEEVPGADVLIVAFTGSGAKFNAIRPFDFFQLTGLLRYHRILVREPWHYCYLKGIDKTGLEGLVNRLRGEITRLAPKRVLFIGVSSGGYAALLLGYLLEPDYVHAFSPYTYLDYFNAIKDGSYRDSLLRWAAAMIRVNLLAANCRRYLDLRPLLTKYIGKTRFYLHACAHSSDRVRAQHVENCQNTRVFLYPCDSHNVTWGMIKNKSLYELLQAENLDDAEAIYQRHYADFDPNDPACKGCRGNTKKEMAAVLKKQEGAI
jgi:hypothetical protein